MTNTNNQNEGMKYDGQISELAAANMAHLSASIICSEAELNVWLAARELDRKLPNDSCWYTSRSEIEMAHNFSDLVKKATPNEQAAIGFAMAEHSKLIRDDLRKNRFRQNVLHMMIGAGLALLTVKACDNTEENKQQPSVSHTDHHYIIK